MARRILVRQDGVLSQLMEQPADSEYELQEVLRVNPDLVPLDDLGLDGPMLVLGVETSLRSGRADLLAATQTGEVLIVEFKTGPQNSDFRHALAQLLDYGADLWRMDVAALEASAVDYFGSVAVGQEQAASGLRDAAVRTWGDHNAFQAEAFEQGIAARLEDGGFHFVLVAQVITTNMRETIAYLQQTHATGHFHGVELVKFSSANDDVVAYEGRAVTTAPRRRSARRSAASLATILEGVEDIEHGGRLRRLADYCQSLGMSQEVGSAGVSIRLQVPDRKEPVTVLWIYPPGSSGWMGLRGLNFGVDTATVRAMVVQPLFASYIHALQALPGTTMERGNLRGIQMTPAQFEEAADQVKDALGDLAASVGEHS